MEAMQRQAAQQQAAEANAAGDQKKAVPDSPALEVDNPAVD